MNKKSFFLTTFRIVLWLSALGLKFLVCGIEHLFRDGFWPFPAFFDVFQPFRRFSAFSAVFKLFRNFSSFFGLFRCFSPFSTVFGLIRRVWTICSTHSQSSSTSVSWCPKMDRSQRSKLITLSWSSCNKEKIYLDGIGTKLCEEHRHKKSHIIRQPWTLQEARYDLATQNPRKVFQLGRNVKDSSTSSHYFSVCLTVCVCLLETLLEELTMIVELGES